MIRSLGGRTITAHGAPPIAIPRPKAAADTAESVGVGLPAYLETFDQADSTTLGPELDWVSTVFDTSAQLATVGNELSAVEGATTDRYSGLAYADIALPTGDIYTQVTVTAIDDPYTAPPHITTLQQGFVLGARQPNDADRVAHLASVGGFWLWVQRDGDDPWQVTLGFNGMFLFTSLVDGSASGLPYQHGVELTDGLTVGDVVRLEVTGDGGAETVRALVNGTVIDERDTSELSGYDSVLALLASTYGRYGSVGMDVFGTPGGLTLDNFIVGALGPGVDGDPFPILGDIDGGGP